jgi:hypothetical protein
MGDDIFESSFGDVTDGIHNEAGGSTKNYNQITAWVEDT